MAGPIIEAIRQMRQNRMDRRAMGIGPFGGQGGPIRNLLSLMRPPVSDRDAFASMAEYVPDAPGAEQAFRPVFHSLGGVRSARQDARGATVVAPPSRAMQSDPAGPDTDPKRPYDGDGNGTPADAKPEVVRGETNNLPAPPSPAATPALQSRHADAISRLTAERDRVEAARSNAKSVVEFNHWVMTAARIERDLARLHGQVETERQEFNDSPEGFADKINKAAAAAMLNGDWTTHALMYKKMLASRNERDGSQDDPLFLETAAREAAAPHVLGRAAEVYERYGRLEDMPGNEYAALMRGFKHVFPMTPVVAKNPKEVAKWWMRVRQVLNEQYNPGNDPSQTAYWGSVATAIRDQYTGPINSGQ